MMFSELASIRLDGAKQAALLLHSLAPADRDWVLSQLNAEQHGELQPLIAELDGMGLSSHMTALGRGALADDLGNTATLGSQLAAGAAASATKTAVTDLEFLMALGPESILPLARTWSAEQPDLVAYALKVQQWPWHEALLERLPASQRSRVQSALNSMAKATSETKLTVAVMGSMRKCCEVLRLEGSSASSEATAAKSANRGAAHAEPLQSLLQGWKRLATGLRREAP